MIRIPKHDLGFSISGWTRYEMHQTRLDLSIVFGHTGSSNNYKSIVEGGLITGGTSDRTGRQASFLSTVDPLEEPLPDFIKFPTDEPRIGAPQTFKKIRS